MLVLYPGRIGIWSFGFCEKKMKNLQKNPQSKTKTNNKLNPGVASGENQTHAR